MFSFTVHKPSWHVRRVVLDLLGVARSSRSGRSGTKPTQFLYRSKVLTNNTTWCEGGGGQKTKWKTPSPNFVELIESITNMLFFFSGGSRKKSYEV